MTSSSVVVSLPGGELRMALGAVPGTVEIVEWSLEGAAPRSFIDLVVLPASHGSETFRWLGSAKTRLLQSQSNGYDGIEAWLPVGSSFANACSVHETATAELALALMLASQRGLPDFVRAAERGQWSPRRCLTLADSVVLLIGYGGIGHAIEERLAPFEVSVIRCARTARTDEHGVIYGVSELGRFLPRADIVVLAVPLTDSTRGLVDDAFLSRMSDGALLVNVGRGPTVDTEALLAHTVGGRLRAALDVTEPEPLPDGHPLFCLPNVLITPHVGGGAAAAAVPRMARLVREQIERMLRDEPPLNVVLRT